MSSLDYLILLAVVFKVLWLALKVQRLAERLEKVESLEVKESLLDRKKRLIKEEAIQGNAPCGEINIGKSQPCSLNKMDIEGWLEPSGQSLSSWNPEK